MPLNEHEQQILNEIEQRLREDDPKFAQTVAKVSRTGGSRGRQRLAVVGFLLGLLVMLGSFTWSALVAGLGFVIMVASAAWLAMSMRSSRRESSASVSVVEWADRFRQRWRRDR